MLIKYKLSPHQRAAAELRSRTTPRTSIASVVPPEHLDTFQSLGITSVRTVGLRLIHGLGIDVRTSSTVNVEADLNILRISL